MKIKDPQVLSILDATPSCVGKELIELCLKKKRQPNAYQVFVGECLRRKKVRGFDDAPGKMRECAAEWGDQKRRK